MPKHTSACPPSNQSTTVNARTPLQTDFSNMLPKYLNSLKNYNIFISYCSQRKEYSLQFTRTLQSVNYAVYVALSQLCQNTGHRMKCSANITRAEATCQHTTQLKGLEYILHASCSWAKQARHTRPHPPQLAIEMKYSAMMTFKFYVTKARGISSQTDKWQLAVSREASTEHSISILFKLVNWWHNFCGTAQVSSLSQFGFLLTVCNTYTHNSHTPHNPSIRHPLFRLALASTMPMHWRLSYLY